MSDNTTNDVISPEKIRRLLLRHLKAFVMLFLFPSRKTYDAWEAASDEITETAYSIWELYRLEMRNAQQDEVVGESDVSSPADPHALNS